MHPKDKAALKVIAVVFGLLFTILTISVVVAVVGPLHREPIPVRPYTEAEKREFAERARHSAQAAPADQAARAETPDLHATLRSVTQADDARHDEIRRNFFAIFIGQHGRDCDRIISMKMISPGGWQIRCSNATYYALFDGEDGDLFEWQGR